jgi:hypothetical protein
VVEKAGRKKLITCKKTGMIEENGSPELAG